jgi:drug/metabolite transporter (DMT)-like permease
VRFRILLAFAATYFVWGSTYLASAFVVAEMPPFLAAGFRNTIAGLLLYAWLRFRGAARPDAVRWREATKVGLLLLGVGAASVMWALRTEPSGVVALVVSLVPLWLILLARFGPHRESGSWVELGGVAIGVAGMLILVAPWGLGNAVVTPAGLAVLLLGTAAWSAGSLYSRTLPVRRDPFLTTSMEMLVGGIALVVVGGLVGDWGAVDPRQFTMRGVASMAYLIVFGSIIGFSAYKWLLTKVRPALAGTYAFVNPLVAVLLGWAFADEPLSARLIVAMLLIVSAVAMISLRPYLRRP